MADEQVVETAAVPDAKPAESSPAPDPKPTEGGEKTPEQVAADAAEKEKHEAAEREEEEKIKRKPWFQKRIDEQTKKYREQERRAERLEQSLQQALDVIARAQPKPEAPAKTAEPQFVPTRPAPTREQFDFDEDKFIAAAVEWKFEQNEAQRQAKAQREAQQRSQQQFVTDIETRRTATLQKGAEKYPDFDTVVGSLPGNVMNHELAIAVLETDSPSDVAYHLGKHPAEAERISKLPPLRKAIELGKLEASLVAAAKPKTSAPPPVTPVGGKEPATTNPDELPINEWLKLRKAGKI